MPRITGIALRSAHGDLTQTLSALDGGHGDPDVLIGELIPLMLAVAHEALGKKGEKGEKREKPVDHLIVATTKGDLPRWCADLMIDPSTGDGGPAWVAQQIATALNITGFAISGACASGPLALAVAARGILAGRWRRVVVIGADRIVPFIQQGFAALKALDPLRCRPFDAQRAGLRLGETIAAVVLEKSDDSDDHGLFLQGWAGGMDANHLTGPTRDGSGLARTLSAALQRAKISEPALVIAHGTGTRYNDDSESLAYATVCPPQTPVTGFKGMLGHSLGACGVSELALAVRIRERDRTPGCANLQQAGCAGAIRLLPPGVHVLPPGAILLANAGFGGINGALVLGARPPSPMQTCSPRQRAWARLDTNGWQRERDGIRDHAAWSEPSDNAGLPRLSARCVLGRVEATWGRMDLACRAFVALGHLLGPFPENSALVLATGCGSAGSDRLHDHAVRIAAVDPQRFPYTLPTTPIGEASIRLGVRGPGLSVHGADESTVQALAHDLLADGVPGVLIAWIEADLPPHLAQAQWWTAE